MGEENDNAATTVAARVEPDQSPSVCWGWPDTLVDLFSRQGAQYPCGRMPGDGAQFPASQGGVAIS